MNEQETKPMAKEVALNLKISEEMATLIGRTSYDLDKNKSELVRCCILLALPLIKTMPSLINRIQLEDYKLNDK